MVFQMDFEVSGLFERRLWNFSRNFKKFLSASRFSKGLLSGTGKCQGIQQYSVIAVPIQNQMTSTVGW